MAPPPFFDNCVASYALDKKLAMLVFYNILIVSVLLQLFLTGIKNSLSRYLLAVGALHGRLLVSILENQINIFHYINYKIIL